MPTTTPASSVPSLDETRAALERIGQHHVLRFVDDLNQSQQRNLCAQIADLPLGEIPTLVERYVKAAPEFSPPAELQPAPFYPDDRDKPVSLWGRERYEKAGEDLIRAGKVAAFTVAGGQGTRLGYDGPKGCYPAGAVTKKPLFEMLAESIHAAQDRYGATIPWAIMTSPLNHDATAAFFNDNKHFGLDPGAVMFFPQGVMPSFDMGTGALLLSEKHRVATNPDGHGGSLRALRNSGVLERLGAMGVEHLSYCQVDNPIVRVVDPLFMGLHATADDSSGEMSSKMVLKTNPAEKVGVFAQSAGKTHVMEYSDLPANMADATDRDGTLLFKAANIAVHALSLAFIEKLTSGDAEDALPYHRAEKKVPHVDLATGATVEPSAPNAVKLEMFVFDALPKCGRSLVMETLRVEEFAPIKNASGVDSPESSARIQTERAARWLEAAGVSIPRNADGLANCTLEISPRTAMTMGDLQKHLNLPSKVGPGESLAI
ncbi:MAG: UTP--glucose-1-phosphate uridylyltransferase [Phycisphaerales bacterium]